MDKSTVYSISAITKIVEGGFRELFDEFLFWCKAEIGGFKKYGTRWYLDLFEYGPNGKTKAKITGIVRQDSIMQAFLRNTGNTIETVKGKEVLIQGYISFSAQYGLSLSILGFSSEFEKGKQVQNLELIRKSLIKKGIYTANKEKKLPLIAKNFALISSEQSEGLKDFLSVLDDSGLHFEHTLYKSPIDGNKAIDGVKKAFENIKNSWIMYDAVILLRGGGGKEGFAWQNTIEVTESVALCDFPVIVAIGHTADGSILDDIAWSSKKTPTDAGWFFVERIQEISSDIERNYQGVQTLIKSRFATYKELQKMYIDGINRSVQSKILLYKKSVSTYFTSIITYSPENLFNKGYSLVRKGKRYVSLTDQSQLCPGDSIEIDSKNTTISAIIKEIK